MAQSDPPASYTDPQPRRSTRLPKPSKRDPNFIYEDFQCHLQNFDDPDERDLLPSPSLFSDSQGRDQKETKRKVKHASSKQSTKVPDPGHKYAELQSKLLDLHLYDLGQVRTIFLLRIISQPRFRSLKALTISPHNHQLLRSETSSKRFA